ncbi:hypothetical protein [Nocardia sp. NPDC005745]|uniref:hypothetical protein n=1 Tax=Nocardia sp. NPDC005745 TaxID=3157061 RepID=UPI0034000927
MDLVAGAVFPLELVGWKFGAALLFVDGGLSPGASLRVVGVVAGAVLLAGCGSAEDRARCIHSDAANTPTVNTATATHIHTE